MRRLTIFLSAVALLVPTAAIAQSGTSTLFKGDSSQKRPVTSRITGVRADYLRIRWTARCRNGSRYAGVTIWRGLGLNAEGRFRATATYDDQNLQKFDGRIAARVAGRRAGDKLFGTFIAALTLTRNGKRVTTCASHNVPWSAKATEVVGTSG